MFSFRILLFWYFYWVIEMNKIKLISLLATVTFVLFACEEGIEILDERGKIVASGSEVKEIRMNMSI